MELKLQIKNDGMWGFLRVSRLHFIFKLLSLSKLKKYRPSLVLKHRAYTVFHTAVSAEAERGVGSGLIPPKFFSTDFFFLTEKGERNKKDEK